MSIINNFPGGSGVDVSAVTAAANDVRSGKVIVDKNGDPIVGSLATRGTGNVTFSDGSVIIPKGIYDSQIEKRTGANPYIIAKGEVIAGVTGTLEDRCEYHIIDYDDGDTRYSLSFQTSHPEWYTDAQNHFAIVVDALYTPPSWAAGNVLAAVKNYDSVAYGFSFDADFSVRSFPLDISASGKTVTFRPQGEFYRDVEFAGVYTVFGGKGED